MATHRLPILGNCQPDTSGKVWWEPYSLLATNDVWPMAVLRVDENGNNNTALSTRVGAYGQFMVPKNYIGTAKIIVVWTSTLTTGDVVIVCDYRAVGGNDAESLDQTGNQEAVTVTDTAPGAAHRRLEASMTLTAANLAVDDTVEFFLGCDGVAAGDTLAGARIIVDAFFEYTDA